MGGIIFAPSALGQTKKKINSAAKELIIRYHFNEQELIYKLHNLNDAVLENLLQ